MGAHTSTPETKKEKVEKLFRQNNRSNRSRSLDTRSEKAVRPIGASHSAKFPKTRCIPPKFQGEGPSGHLSGLTLDQKREIEMCWVKCSQKQLKKTGEDIFWSILQTDDEILSLFYLDKVARNKIRDNDMFKSHAANFVIVLNLVVSNLGENIGQACDALQTLGAQHVQFKSRGFQSLYWDIFTDCFERNSPPTFKTRSEKESWSRMILFILSQMKTGYADAENLRINRYLVPPSAQ